MTAAVIRIAPEKREDGTVRGYASVFGAVDLSGDEVLRGAFATSLRQRGAAGVKMLWQHDPGRPIGVWTALREDKVGLWAEGRLALDTSGGREAYGLIRAGALDGLSIGFRTKRAERGGGLAKRRLAEIDLWEISVVTFPMQELARLAMKRALKAPLAAASDLVARIRAGARSLGSPLGVPA
ncbi:HK97 family phage prohead protease [Aureimonas leprariae]|uniref:HK97 family phage prohead protease n=1 Tax=Plantimonas leprariae TaxID=2615207 RepID=A0A7V7PPJ1_9HYPH|nr:HK97 family phage prohead protease [Aureimonas leprariae]KAB0679953.1 HK97 family phage prohead protease [Aureimonas leprariae]